MVSPLCGTVCEPSLDQLAALDHMPPPEAVHVSVSAFRTPAANKKVPASDASILAPARFCSLESILSSPVAESSLPPYLKMIVVPLGRTRIRPVPEIHAYSLSAPLPGAPNVP